MIRPRGPGPDQRSRPPAGLRFDGHLAVGADQFLRARVLGRVRDGEARSARPAADRHDAQQAGVAGPAAGAPGGGTAGSRPRRGWTSWTSSAPRRVPVRSRPTTTSSTRFACGWVARSGRSPTCGRAGGSGRRSRDRLGGSVQARRMQLARPAGGEVPESRRGRRWVTRDRHPGRRRPGSEEPWPDACRRCRRTGAPRPRRRSVAGEEDSSRPSSPPCSAADQIERGPRRADPADWYLERFPAVADDPELALDLYTASCCCGSPPAKRLVWRANSGAVRTARPGPGDCRSPSIAPSNRAWTSPIAPTTRPRRRSRGCTPAILPDIPGYEVIRELGAGGMGVVYGAYQLGLKRRVALKMACRRIRRSEQPPLPGGGRGRRVWIIKTSSRSTRSASTPGGRSSRWPSSEGGTLAQRSAQGPMSAREAAQIAETLARAVDFAHRHGDHPPRPQAGERAAHARGDAQDRRLRAGQGPGQAIPPDAERDDPRLAVLHVARAGGGEPPRGRPGQRRLRAGGDPLRDAHRRPAVPRRDARWRR